MSRARSNPRRRKRRINRPRKPVEKEYTFGKEALWSTFAAAALLIGIVGYVVWSFHVHGYAHIYMSIILIALLTTIVAAMFVSLWWSRRRKRTGASRPRRRPH